MKKRCFVLAIALCAGMAVAQQATWEDKFHWGNDVNGADATVAVDLIHTCDGESARVISLTRRSRN